MKRHGLTLLELLVAIGLSSVIVYIALDLVRDEGKHYTKTRDKVKLQSDAKEALRIMEGEMRNIGFNYSLPTSRIAAEPSPCTGTSDARVNAGSGDTSSFKKIGASATALGTDTVVYLFHEPNTDYGLDACGVATLRSIGYRYNAGRLERQYCQGAGSLTCNSSWVPFLDSVKSFHLQYGVTRLPKDTLFAPSLFTNASNWASPNALAVSWNTGVSPAEGTITGFNNTGHRVIRLTTAIDSFLPSHTYIVQFQIQAKPRFFTDVGSIAAGFFSSAGAVGAATDTIRVYPGVSFSNNFRDITLVYNPTTASINGRFFGFIGRTANAPASLTDSVVIRNVRIRRMDRGGYVQWVNNPTTAQKNFTKAVRLSVLVKTRKQQGESSPGTFSASNLGGPASYTPSGVDTKYSYILFQRIVPVVSNGSKN